MLLASRSIILPLFMVLKIVRQIACAPGKVEHKKEFRSFFPLFRQHRHHPPRPLLLLLSSFRIPCPRLLSRPCLGGVRPCSGGVSTLAWRRRGFSRVAAHGAWVLHSPISSFWRPSFSVDPALESKHRLGGNRFDGTGLSATGREREMGGAMKFTRFDW